MTGRLSFSELFPQPYNGQEITSFLQVPDDAYSAGRPEFTEFSEEAYDYWHDQSKYRDPENVKPEYLKLKMNDFQVVPASAISKKPN